MATSTQTVTPQGTLEWEAKVFRQSEMLKLTLLHLPLQKLLEVKRICRVFLETIDKLVLIQQALFLSPSMSEEMSCRIKEFRTYAEPPKPRTESANEWYLEGSGRTVIPLLNPFFAAHRHQSLTREALGKWFIRQEWNYPEKFRYGEGNFAMPADLDRASIQPFEAEMFLTQSLMRKLRVTVVPYRSFYIHASDGVGLRIKDLLNVASNLPASHLPSVMVVGLTTHSQYNLQNIGGCRFLGYSAEQITGWDILRVFQHSTVEVESWKDPTGSWNESEHPLGWLNEFERRRRLGVWVDSRWMVGL